MSPRNRFYGLALLGSSLLWVGAFVLQDRAHTRSAARMQTRIDDLAASFASFKSAPVASAPSPVVNPTTTTGSFPFRVEGSGRSGSRWVYLDIRHVDGSRRRYYASLDEGQRGLDRMMRSIDLDSVDAQYGVLIYSAPSVASKQPADLPVSADME